MSWAAMRFALVAALALLAIVPPASAQRWPAVTAEALSVHVRELADDRYAGRAPGTPGGEAAARYIAGRFAAAGLRPVGREDDAGGTGAVGAGPTKGLADGVE